MRQHLHGDPPDERGRHDGGVDLAAAWLAYRYLRDARAHLGVEPVDPERDKRDLRWRDSMFAEMVPEAQRYELRGASVALEHRVDKGFESPGCEHIGVGLGSVRAGSEMAIGAFVVAVADLAGGALIATVDRRDLERLATHATDVAIADIRSRPSTPGENTMSSS